MLNSIAGQGFKEATLGCCAKNSGLIEMSKLNVWSTEEVKDLRPDVNFFIVDLRMLDVTQCMQLSKTAENCIVQGHCKPIPYIKFDALNIRLAMQYFQRDKHIGKVVCVVPEITI